MKYLQVLREKQVDGIIFSSEVLKEEYYEALKSMDVPVVLVATHSEYKSVPYVKVDDWKASYEATEYLIHQGHRHIAMLGGNEGDAIAGKPRIDGYKQALLDNGIVLRDELVFDGCFQFDCATAAAEKLLLTVPEVTAVFAASDEMAIALISVAAKHGISVPDQISVIGYDNLKLAKMSNPPLTTVAQPLYKMGKLAAYKLISMITSKERVVSEIVPHEIIERNTVKRLI
ncbi:Catabolite control protein A [compost metagenome]